MPFDWKQAFSQGELPWNGTEFLEPVKVSNLTQLKHCLDEIHIKLCLLKPYFETENYPLVELRDLLPSFDCDIFEYHHLPGFSMVAFERPLSSFEEIFQYDILHPLTELVEATEGEFSTLDSHVMARNILSLQARLCKKSQDALREVFTQHDVTALEEYPALLPFLLEMDRAHVMAHDPNGSFHLAGMYASFPSDTDGEIKRFGLRTGKFRLNDNALYERNRLFVYQYLMELYGFPVASERRTSAAMFARRLYHMNEPFLIRVLGQSDRTMTTIWNSSWDRHYPMVEKIALVRLENDQHELINSLQGGGFFVDEKNHVVIVRFTYRQHRFSPDNVRQDRALSIDSQGIVHPLTGDFLPIRVTRDTTTLILRFNDIVRGEFSGRMVYKRNEIVENTDTHEKRLKCIFSWLSKHQRRIIGYSDEFYAHIAKVLEPYLNNGMYKEEFDLHKEVYQEVLVKYAYIRQARKVHLLEGLRERKLRGESISYNRMLKEVVELLHNLKFELGNYFEPLVHSIIHQCQAILNDAYLRRTYIDRSEEGLTPSGQEIRKNYRKLVALHDELAAIRKSRNIAVPD